MTKAVPIPKTPAGGFDPTPRGESFAKWRTISGSILWKNLTARTGSRVSRAATSPTSRRRRQRNLFVPVAPGERFQSPFVAMGSTGSRDGAGVVRRMDYPAHSALGFLCTWREEYLERPCDRLATDSRGGPLPARFDRQPGGGRNGRNGRGAASIDALSAHLAREMAAKGGGKAWAPIDGCWRWDFDLDAGLGEAPVLGSPVVDLALGGDAMNPGASAAAELAAARRAVLGDDVEDARVAELPELGKAAGLGLGSGFPSKDGNEEEKKEKEKKEEEEEEEEEKEERVALGAAETVPDADAAEPVLIHPERSRRSPRAVTSPPVNRWGEPEPDVPCVVCGEIGGDADFILCDGCPSGGHVDCLNLPNPHSLAAGGSCAVAGSNPGARDDWFCDACEGGKLAGIQPRAAAASRSPPRTGRRWNARARAQRRAHGRRRVGGARRDRSRAQRRARRRA